MKVAAFLFALLLCFLLSCKKQENHSTTTEEPAHPKPSLRTHKELRKAICLLNKKTALPTLELNRSAQPDTLPFQEIERIEPTQIDTLGKTIRIAR